MYHEVKHDVVVIGAGPAGAWTAYLLARRGARVLIVDPSHPREKPCGGGVTGRALSLVADGMGGQLPAVGIRSARFVDSTTGVSAAVRFDDARPDRAIVVASRSAFDLLLLDAARRAGAQLVATRATDVRQERGSLRLDTSDGQTRTSGFVVGADGASSLARRRLARPFRRDQLSVATGFFAHGETSDEIVIELTDDPPGYLWSFPRPDHLAIGICAQADAGIAAGALRARAAAWIRKAGVARGTHLEPYSWPIPSLSARDFETIEPGGPGWLLVGDAAGLVDPITREGIFFALQSAACAADAVSSDSPERARQYRDLVREEIAPELARAARFKTTFFRPSFIRLLVEALGSSDRIRGVMADLIAGTQAYRGLEWRLARTMELGLAYRLVSGSRIGWRRLARAVTDGLLFDR
jgi:geranylgeranyl reductase family protein